MQTRILEALRKILPEIVKNRDEFSDKLKSNFKEAGIGVPASLFKAILMALSERDETADICVDSEGNPEPDTELRDYENVPLKEDIGEYMEREVPHVPDAWADESKTKVGMRSISTAIFTNTHRQGRWMRLKPILRRSRKKSRTCSRR